MNGDRLFLLAIILVIIYLTVIPIAVMIFGSLQSGLPGTWTPLTFANYGRAFSHAALYSRNVLLARVFYWRRVHFFLYRNFSCMAHRADRHAF